MGRYRSLVRALVYYSNASTIAVDVKKSSVDLSQLEYQVLEHIVEFENDTKIMADISRDLGIKPSRLTNITKRLLRLELVERYQLEYNKKNVILKPTQKGREMYVRICTTQVEPVFLKFFSELEQMSDQELEQFERAVRILSDDWRDLSDSKLIKL